MANCNWSEAMDDELLSLLKVDNKGWNALLFQNDMKILLCAICNHICVDAVELGCDHIDDDIYLYCNLCLKQLITDNDGNCPFNKHLNPDINSNRSIRRQISNGIVICPYSTEFKHRNVIKENNNDGGGIIDGFNTPGNEQKEGIHTGCIWKGTLTELITNHLNKCTMINNASYIINKQNTTIKHIKHENKQLKQQLSEQNEMIQQYEKRIEIIQHELNDTKMKLYASENQCNLQNKNKDLLSESDIVKTHINTAETEMNILQQKMDLMQDLKQKQEEEVLSILEEKKCEDENKNIENAVAIKRLPADDWRLALWSLQPENIKVEWIKYVGQMTQSFMPCCPLSTEQCDSVSRLIFMMKYYAFWMKCKAFKAYNPCISDIFNSLTDYNRSKLLSDYLHCKRHHFDDTLIAYIQISQIPDCSDITDKGEICVSLTRNHQNKMIYQLSNGAQRELYFMNNNKNIKESSTKEMLEINLQKLLDVIHSSLLHNAVSNCEKFVTTINIQQSHGDKSMVRMKCNDHDYTLEKPKFANLKTELLNNSTYKLSRDEFASIYIAAQEYIKCEEGGKNIQAERDKFGISKGTKIKVEHIIVLLIQCNYSELKRQFNIDSWLKINNKEDMDKLKRKNHDQEIANWKRLLIEAIICFGGIVDETQNIYHCINHKIMMKRTRIQFNVPVSCTTKCFVAKKIVNNYSDGICLKLGINKFIRDTNYILDVSDFSDFPNENEVLMFGNQLLFFDVIYDSISHHDYILSLDLYQRIITGKWIVTHPDFQNKDHQYKIIKMIQNMMKGNMSNNVGDDNEFKQPDQMNSGLELNNIDPYIQSLFESITKHVNHRIIWINIESFSLLIKLKTEFFDKFIPFLQKRYNIKVKYSFVYAWSIQKKYLLMTNRQNPLKAKPVEISINNNTYSGSLKLTFGFRCYKKYNSAKKQDMFKGEFYMISLPSQIQSVKMLGGLWFAQISLSKWDWCSFSEKKKSRGNSLFAIDEINDELKIKVCYQVKEINDTLS